MKKLPDITLRALSPDGVVMEMVINNRKDTGQPDPKPEEIARDYAHLMTSLGNQVTHVSVNGIPHVYKIEPEQP